MKILFLHGASKYNALNLFLDEIMLGMEMLGHNTEKIKLLDDDSYTVQKDDILITFNHIGVTDELITSLRRQKNTIVSIFVDHPYYHQERLKKTYNEMHITFACKEHINSLNLLGLNKNCSYHFMPHGGPNKTPKVMPWCQRNENLLLVASVPCNDHKEIQCLPSEKVVEILSSVEDEYNNSNNMNSAIISVANKFGIKSNNTIKALFNASAEKLFTKKRYNDRLRALINLSKNNIIDIYGPSTWVDFIDKHNLKNINYKKEISMRESLTVIGEYKYVINDCGFFNFGCHERNLNAIMSGAMPVCYNNEYTRLAFDGLLQDIYSFKPKKK